MSDNLALKAKLPKESYKLFPLIAIESIAISTCFFISIYFSHIIHLSHLATGKLIAASSFGALSGSWISGYLTTRLSPLRVSAIGSFFFSIGYFGVANSHNQTILLICMVMCGLGTVFLAVSNLTALVQTADEKANLKKRLIAIYTAIYNFCGIVAASLMSKLSEDHFPLLFDILSAMCICVSMYLLLLPRRENLRQAESKSTPTSHETFDWKLAALIIICVFSFGTIYSMYKVFFPIHVISNFEHSYKAIIALSFNGLLVVILQAYITKKFQNYSDISMIGFGGLALGVGYFLFGISETYIAGLFFICVGSIGEMIFVPPSKHLATICFTKGKEGLGLGLWRGIYFLSSIIGSYSSGWVGHQYGEKAAWGICLVMGIASGFAMLIYYLSLNIDNPSYNLTPRRN